jgi:hypothetical protein
MKHEVVGWINCYKSEGEGFKNWNSADALSNSPRKLKVGPMT